MTRRLRLTPPDLNPEGLQERDFVQRLNGKRKGVIESLRDDCALVDWLNGRKQLLLCVFLRRVDPDARPDLDRKPDIGF